MRKFFMLLAAAAAMVACGPKKTAVVTTPSAQDFAQYVKAYTGGIVGEDAVLRIELTQDATAQPTEGLFNIKPKVEGTTQWINASTVSFTPAAWKAGQTYSVSFALDKVCDSAPEDPFTFGLAVRGKGEEAQEADEPDNGRPFRVVKAVLRENVVEVNLSKEPANANVKGLVELEGAARSYVQVEEKLLKVHFEGMKGDLVLTLDKNLKDADGNTLGDSFVRNFTANEPKPAVELLVDGNILPDKDQLILPFRAVNLSAVEVRVIKIYEKNVLSFLQENELGESGSLRRCGRLVWRGDVPLDASKNLHQWNTHSIDLSGLVKQEPGAIYRIRLSFRLDQSLYGGKQPILSTQAPTGKPTVEDEETWDTPNPYYWDNDYDWSTYNWDESDDPSKPSFYMESGRFPYAQILASDLGLLAEYAGGNTLWVAATDLLSAKPVSGVSLEVFDYQLQSIATGKTDGKGLASLTVARKPFAVVAKAGGSTSYLKVNSGNERSLSRFDVGGETVQQGIKGFVYGERGVWRPGDTMHLTLILQDKGKNLPEGHPATLEVYTPEGQFYTRQVHKGTDGFYSYDVTTKADDPTGYWNAYFKVGGSTFHKTLHVETVKPNRLKVTTAYPEMLQAGQVIPVRVAASWLAGGSAADCAVRAEMTLRKANIPFKGFEKYSFYDPASQFSSAEHILYKSRTDGTGNASVQVKFPVTEGAPGLLQAFVVTSVEEPGGDESFTTETLPYSPYSAYVGIKVPDGDFLETDKDQPIKLAVVDALGNRVKGHKVEYAVFKTGWNWWWDNPGGDLDAYVNGSSVEKIASGTLTSGANDDTGFRIRVDYPDWGRYLILARDKTSGHTSGRFVTIDWPDFRGRANRRDPESLTMITFSTDKPSYQAGEKATVYLPAAKGGQALVSLENAGTVLKREWVSLSDKDTPYNFTVEPEMAPNIYVHVTLVQPYGSTQNDLPLRLYGVQRVKVENPASHLEPVVTLPQVLHPDEEFTVKVSEKGGKPMTYTLAIVDEGLLDLTAFKTPDPWNHMYKPEALGVSTWDLYDQVIGAFSGKFSPLASIGGDQENVVSARKDNRFNPVVLFQQPRTVTKGTDEVKLTIPAYVGSVRVMVVAGHDGAFGSADKTVPVQNPLMLVTTLPRVLGINEETAIPVNVFAMEDGVKEANVSVKVDGPVSLTGDASKKLTFAAKGDQLVTFGLKATDKEGVAHITVEASGSGHKASETIALTVRNPQPEIVTIERFILQPGESRQAGAGTLQLAGYPAPDARAWFLNMKNYAYECGEQLSSRGLTLVSLLPLLNEEDAAAAKELIPTLISKLYGRQNADGGFAYWSGGKSDTWVSSMAGHFLTEASKAGFEVNGGVLKNWKAYQQKMSQVFRVAGSSVFSTLDEAYRLYSLADAGASQLSSMNRLKEAADMGDRARWMLAAAYALSGKTNLGEGLIESIGKDFPEYDPYNITYGTGFRDKMVALDALALCGRINEALEVAAEPADRWLSTQETAFAAVAYKHLLDKVPTTSIKATVGGQEVKADKGLASCVVAETAAVKNLSEGPLHGTLVKTARTGVRTATSNGLKLEIKYVSAETGATVNPASLPQGTRFQAIIRVSNISTLKGYENLALNFPVASGWEIQNERLTGGASDDGYDFKDIRDDRVNWFFGLPAGRSKTFTVQLRAAYEGRYMLPSTVAEAMYEPAVQAASASGIAVVTK
ncbi:MAG: alpha-2-macroglobulin [Bacteroidales bacterium]|nr:alpha-2-macroglobulin [Bacteroidales bacterium]